MNKDEFHRGKPQVSLSQAGRNSVPSIHPIAFDAFGFFAWGDLPFRMIDNKLNVNKQFVVDINTFLISL